MNPYQTTDLEAVCSMFIIFDSMVESDLKCTSICAAVIKSRQHF